MSARRFVFLFVLGLSASPPAAAQKPGERGLSQQAAEPGFTGTRRVVIIGISRYLNLEGKKQLHYAAADAQMMYEFFRSRAGRSVDTQNIRLLVDTGARAGHMTEALRWLREHSQPGDEAIIYLPATALPKCGPALRVAISWRPTPIPAATRTAGSCG